MPARLAAAETLPRASPRKRVMASCSNLATARSFASWKRSPPCMVAGAVSCRCNGSSDTSTSRLVASTTARSMMFSSSRRLPGQRERLGSEAVDFLVHLRLGFAQEVMREDGDVLDALAERGEGDGEGIEAVEEVLAEFPRSERLLEMTIGRRDDAHVNLAGDHIPHGLALTRLEHAEEPALHLRGHVAHLIEKDRAPVRLLEQARLVGDGAREGAPLVPEELGLEQRGRERRAVHGD